MDRTITIHDETTVNTGSGKYDFTLTFPAEQITVRDLIRTRVKQEVRNYNTHRPEFFRGLVQPSHAEQTLNGFKVPKEWSIDWEKQYARAVDAFRHNGFILLVNDKQVDDLDAPINLSPQTEVTFLKLAPLVAG